MALTLTKLIEKVVPSPFGNISHVSQETENYEIAIIEHEKEKIMWQWVMMSS